MTSQIKVESLTKMFGLKKAVNEISFAAGKGEVIGFLGPNGAGKSTTMKMLTGFLVPSYGTAKIEGYDVLENASKIKACIGYLPEGAPAYGDMTPLSYLSFIAEVRKIPHDLRKTRIETVIKKTHLSTVLDQSIETLSKGFKRRVGLAQAILHDPSILILDEPTDGLDPNQKFEVRKLIAEMAKNKTIIISTHILEEVEAVCTRAIIIANGKIITDSTPQELIHYSEMHNSIHLSVKKEYADTARLHFMKMNGMQRVEKRTEHAHYVDFVLYPQNRENKYYEVAQFLHDKDWTVHQVRLEKGKLDDVFRQLTVSDLS